MAFSLTSRAFTKTSKMFTAAELKQYVESHPKQVRRTTFSDYPDLFILKYKNEVFWEGKWNRFLRECRGLVVDKDYNPVIRPFTKVFNYREQGATYPLEMLVRAERKINGFMAAATYVPMYGEVIVSTTGSLDSPFTKLAREVLERTDALHYIANDSFFHGFTFLFEICDPSDPHIIKEVPGAYLLSCRRTGEWDVPAREFSAQHMDEIGKLFKCFRPRHLVTDFGSIVGTSRSAKHEGWCVYPVEQEIGWKTDPGLKIKTPYYLATKWLARMRTEKLSEALLDIQTLKKSLDEEFYSLIDFIAQERETFIAMDDQQRIALIENFYRENP